MLDENFLSSSVILSDRGGEGVERIWAHLPDCVVQAGILRPAGTQNDRLDILNTSGGIMKNGLVIRITAWLLLIGGMIIALAFLIASIAVLIYFPQGNWVKKVSVALGALVASGVVGIIAVGIYEMIIKLVDKDEPSPPSNHTKISPPLAAN